MSVINHSIFFVLLMGVMTMTSGCRRSSEDFWEDTKTAGRQMQKGFRSLAGQKCYSRQINSKDQFIGIDEDENVSYPDYQNAIYEDNYANSYQGYQEEEFIPLEDPCNEMAVNDYAQTPGEPGSSLPGIHAFKDPATLPHLCAIFQPIYFNYNCYLIKGEANLQAAYGIAEYMRYHPNVYVYIEGHTDERGPHAYNQTLGSKRCNAVRNFLISEGVNPNNLFTISYGKERPQLMDSHEEAWAKNRRSEFKIYER